MDNELEQTETPRYTTILYDVRDKLDVSIAEYVLLDTVYKLSFKTGYCFKSPRLMAEQLGFTKQGLNKMIRRLVDKGLVERLTDDALRTTDKYLAALATGNKVSTKPKKGGNKVTKVETKFPKVETKLANNRGDNNSYNNNINNTTNVVLADKKLQHEQISKIFYEIIKTYKLPNTNNNNVRKWIKQMTTEVEHDKLKEYLEFMRDQFPALELEFKPHINNPYDIYAKRIQIQNIIQSAIKDQLKLQSKVLHL